VKSNLFAIGGKGMSCLIIGQLFGRLIFARRNAPKGRRGSAALEYQIFAWTNVTDKVFPFSPSLNKGYFRLPRVGTAIKLICGDESNERCKDKSILNKFVWDKTKFVTVRV